MFPDDAAAEHWFEQQMWGEHGPTCPDCQSQRHTVTRSHADMPYRCRECWNYFSVRKGSVMHSSKLSYQTWAIALYQIVTGLKGVSAMKLHRDLDTVEQVAAVARGMQGCRDAGMQAALLRLDGLADQRGQLVALL